MAEAIDMQQMAIVQKNWLVDALIRGEFSLLFVQLVLALALALVLVTSASCSLFFPPYKTTHGV